MLNKFLKLIVFAVLLVNLPLMAQEDDSADTQDLAGLDLFDDDTEKTKQGWVQLYASFGVTYLDADGSFDVQMPNGNYFSIFNFDRAGLDETDASHWMTLNWRSANSRWGAWFGSWRYDVKGSTEWEKVFDIPGKEPIPAGLRVSSEFDAKWYIIEATYSFYRTETVDTGIGFGIHAVDLDTNISARVGIGEGVGEIISERLDTLAPLPNVLAYLYWKFAPQWNLVARAGWFGLDYDIYSGQMINSHTMINYEFSPRWALGFGYQFVDLDLDVEKAHHLQFYHIEFSGPMAYLRFSF